MVAAATACDADSHTDAWLSLLLLLSPFSFIIRIRCRYFQLNSFPILQFHRYLMCCCTMYNLHVFMQASVGRIFSILSSVISGPQF